MTYRVTPLGKLEFPYLTALIMNQILQLFVYTQLQQLSLYVRIQTPYLITLNALKCNSEYSQSSALTSEKCRPSSSQIFQLRGPLDRATRDKTRRTTYFPTIIGSTTINRTTHENPSSFACSLSVERRLAIASVFNGLADNALKMVDRLHSILTALFLVTRSLDVHGYSTGAPTDSCVSLLPQHGDNVPQNTPSPYSVQVSRNGNEFVGE